ncbi:MAG TPA: DNA-3-methyladenine glycosylase [Thermoanaerobaculia bacterium]
MPRPLRLPLPTDFDLDWTLGFLATRTVSSLEAVVPGGYRRSVRVSGRPVVLTLDVKEGGDGARFLTVVAPELSTADAKAAVVRMLDLDADLAAFRDRADADPLLRDLVARRPGLRLPQLLDPFEGVMRAVLGQQVSVVAASTLLDRLVRRIGLAAPGGAFLAFPLPHHVAALGRDAIAALGMPRAKAAALHGVAQAVADGALDLERLRLAPGDEAQAALVALPGLGPWTASYVRMRTLGDRDAFPAADLGVVKALRALHPGETLSKRQIETLGERWRPWRAYATLHLWSSL